jgi:hypothetical protein
MRRGEKARFIMRPEYGYATKGCQVAPPAGFAADASFLFDIHLVSWYAKDEVRVASDEGDVYKRSLGEVDTWETPRPPFEVWRYLCEERRRFSVFERAVWCGWAVGKA